ncbi:MAG TPA: glycosyltransferase family 1 protein [Terriglobales bacterium]|nr:glycosyltransferase family 1 protein [Terriglobales bacterium]
MTTNFRVGLNLLYVRPGFVGGGETYARGLLDGLQKLSLPFEFFVLLNRQALPTFAKLADIPGFHLVECSNPLNSWLRHVWEQAFLPGICSRYSIDLLHSLANVIPFFARCKRVVTIHDMLYKVDPSSQPWMRRHVLGSLVTMSARHADAVLTVSHDSARSIKRYTHVPDSKVYLTLEGPGQQWPSTSDWDEIRQKYNLPQRYFLSVGTDSHKRVDVTVRALDILRQKSGLPVSLAVAGWQRHGTALRHNTEGVNFLGYVLPQDLATLFSNATALICSSELEGFGLPVLEAMSMGTPVISTRCGALPEVVGDAGMLVLPDNPVALADVMERVVQDCDLRSRLREKGLVQAGRFSWRECAMATAQAYSEILHIRPNPVSGIYSVS